MAGSVLPAGARGQDADQAGIRDSIRSLSLEKAVAIALEQNFDILIAQYEEDQASADLNRSARVFLPQVHLSETFVSTDDPLTAFGLKLKQERVAQSDFNPAILNNPPEMRNFTTKVEILQPVLNLDGFFGRHAAACAADAAGAKLLRTRYGVELRVKNAYYGFVLAMNSVGVVNEAIRAATAHRDQAKNFRDAGMIQESDYLMAELRLVELEMKKIEAGNTARDAEDQLRITLGMKENVRLRPTDTLGYTPADEPAWSLDEIVHSRSDMKAMQYGIDAAGASVRMQRASFLPSLNAFASYELNDDGIAGTKGRSWTIGAMIRWNIFSGFDHIGELQKASARLSSLETEFDKMKTNSAREVSAAVRAMKSAAKGVDLASLAVRQAEETHRVRSDRYEKGLERTADLLQAEATLSGARLTYLNSLYKHAASLFMLEFLLERKVSQ